MRRIKIGRLLFSLSLIVTGIYLIFVYKPKQRISIVNRTETLEEIDKTIKKQQSGKICKHPKLPINASEIMKFFHDVPPISCNSAYPDWVTVQGSFCIISDEAKRKFGDIFCQFTDVIRLNDNTLTNGQTTHTQTQYQLTNSDVVRVQCKATSGAHWRSVLTGIRHDSSIKSRKQKNLPENVLPLNVLMFGFDSMSHNTFIRKLSKTYRYLVHELNAVVLNGYNIVGDGTPQALIPILTGQNELELPEARKRIHGSNFVDVYPFVWKEFANLGYVTGYLEDSPSIGTFTYRLRGFQKQPTDHYMRTYYMAAEEKFRSSPNYCVGAQPRHKIPLKYIEDFFRTYKKKNKFMFGFHAELSHDDTTFNLIGAADDDVAEWLQRLFGNGYLNNTMMMFFSDHGHRYAKLRNTIQGKQEERLPFFSIVLPKWFQHKYKVAYENLKNNVNRLTTPYDIYPTIKHLLNWQDFNDGDLQHRSISLFKRIPEERSCADAYIEPHWCTCLDWEPIPIDVPIVADLANALTNKINNYTSIEAPNFCQPLQVKQIMWATKLAPNQDMLKFVGNADYDGFIGDFSAKMTVKMKMYQIKVLMEPNNGIYEASIRHFANGHFHVSLNDISRINKYGSQPKCIFDKNPDLRKYCYCVA